MNFLVYTFMSIVFIVTCAIIVTLYESKPLLHECIRNIKSDTALHNDWFVRMYEFYIKLIRYHAYYQAKFIVNKHRGSIMLNIFNAKQLFTARWYIVMDGEGDLALQIFMSSDLNKITTANPEQEQLFCLEFMHLPKCCKTDDVKYQYLDIFINQIEMELGTRLPSYKDNITNASVEDTAPVQIFSNTV